jgi:hypothetical protein
MHHVNADPDKDDENNRTLNSSGHHVNADPDKDDENNRTLNSH